jgi:hypothetical protein
MATTTTVVPSLPPRFLQRRLRPQSGATTWWLGSSLWLRPQAALWGAYWDRLEDRAGSGRLVETYPAAALKGWSLTHHSYKGKDKAKTREALVTSLLAAAPWIDIIGGVSGICLSDHCLDAVISGLIALAAKAGLTFRPKEGDETFWASQEGWIHLPSCTLTELGDPA